MVQALLRRPYEVAGAKGLLRDSYTVDSAQAPPSSAVGPVNVNLLCVHGICILQIQGNARSF
jgi:hypothetical protein